MLVRFIDAHGDEIYINPSHVISVEPAGLYTKIYIAMTALGSHWYRVPGRPAEVAQRLDTGAVM